MGFLKRLFGGKKKEIPALELSIEEIKTMLEKELASQKSNAEAEVAKKFSEIKYLLKKLSGNLETLENAKVDVEKGNVRLRKIVNTTKRELVKEIYWLIEKLRPPEGAKFPELQEYCLNANKTLEKELAGFGKNIAYTGIVLKEEIKAIGNTVKELRNVFLFLNNYFKKSRVVLLAGITEDVTEFEELLGGKASLTKTSSKIVAELENARLSEQELVGELNQLKNSPDMAKLEEKNKKIEILMEETEEIRVSLFNLLATVEKPLKRLLQLSLSGAFPLEREEEKLLGQYLKDPITAIKEDSKMSGIKEILRRTTALLQDGTISLKEKEKGKKIEQLNKLMKFDFFGEVFWKINKIESEINALKKELYELNIKKEIENKEREISDTKSRLHEIAAELRRTRMALEKKDENAALIKSKIEHSLSEGFPEKISIKSV